MRFDHTAVLANLCWTTFLAAAQTTPAPSDYDQGAALIQKNQFAAAIPFLNRTVESHPKDARAWKALGVAYAAQGMFELAEHPFGQACKLDPKLDDACYFYGRALYTLNRFQPSLEVLANALRNNGKDWKVRLGVAQALEALGEAGRAEAEFRESLADSRGTDPRPGTAYGLFLVRQGRFREAIVPLQDVLSRFPESPDAHIHIGRALTELGRNQEASAHFEEAVRLDPTSAQAHLLLGKAYLRAGRQAEAASHLEAAARYEAGSRTVR